MNGWYATVGSILRTDKILQWRISADDNCVLCHGGKESHNLLFFDCQYLKLVWGQILSKWGGRGSPQSIGNENEIMKRLSFGAKAYVSVTLLKLGLAAAISHLWRERNCSILQAKGTNSDVVILSRRS